MAVAFKHRSLPGPTSGICVAKRWEQSRCFFFSGELLAVGNCGEILGTRVVPAELVTAN